ncbi:MAG: hypothetical protein H6Q89_2102 [Myxococcaceae bacterium]|nr:hypothetical protein [Myxococcaceae bacterium]
MDNNHVARISVTPTIARQTPKNDFGQVLNSSLNGVLQAGSVIGSLTGMPIISSAVSAVSSLVNNNAVARTSAAASGVINLGGSSPGIGSVSGGGAGGGIAVGTTVAGAGMGRTAATAGVEPAGMNDMLSSMRAEADRSMMMQLQMQNESREYNTLTNILKLRHDSAKAAINNIR